MSRVVFLDRDGVVNKERKNEYVKNWTEFSFLPGVLDSLRNLTRAGFQIIVVTNQSKV
jgi:HAD superfamily hydrolase (TIGR01662 family)